MSSHSEHKFDKMQFGFWPGLLGPLLVFAIVYLLKSEDQSLTEYINSLWKFNVLIKLLSLCVFPNLLLFLFFIRKKYDWAARGVLMATFIYAFVVLFSKLF
ncbi:MAG: hypothetical protein A2W90_22945 [Bacteroidetes bacterium GWF2_42_66]|nr:MAG: hypothetical protein A2W92_02755 [Bacteroidetes bacterium GWA2_42_15]OFX99467.1 MAG: hypothetical protein A2W89_12630 [Bacteroidetes bacterium GWE2_42_39]OFY46998.1 MAG: hypothetical protein A2W90_22945 [Bacteroidetes bacterium GWF2_42_66]HBL76847.1 hypothetical protein [Prolixibacteraceae bacterium]HCR90482.1 hypothetical protein [Prolixibacteraceae bacterium]